MKALQLIHRSLLKLEDLILLLLVAAIISLPVIQILSRLLDWQGLLWADQAARLCVLWLALTGAMIASRKQQHIRIDLLQHFSNRPWSAVINRLTHLATALICGVIAWYSAGLVYTDYQYGSRAFLELPLWLCEIIIPVAFTSISLRFGVAALTAKPIQQPGTSQ